MRISYFAAAIPVFAGMACGSAEASRTSSREAHMLATTLLGSLLSGMVAQPPAATSRVDPGAHRAAPRAADPSGRREVRARALQLGRATKAAAPITEKHRIPMVEAEVSGVIGGIKVVLNEPLRP